MLASKRQEDSSGSAEAGTEASMTLTNALQSVRILMVEDDEQVAEQAARPSKQEGRQTSRCHYEYEVPAIEVDPDQVANDDGDRGQREAVAKRKRVIELDKGKIVRDQSRGVYS